jgi:ribonuclease PH
MKGYCSHRHGPSFIVAKDIIILGVLSIKILSNAYAIIWEMEPVEGIWEGYLARIDARGNDEPRMTRITPGFQPFAEGSALIEMGHTKVICAATVEERIPGFLRGSGKGWITAEYSMLPRSTHMRTSRNTIGGRTEGRSTEIQRLIGRSLRAVAVLTAMGERTIILDCDVLQADGGTRTAAITGAYVALYQALTNLVRQGVLSSIPLRSGLSAISVGIVGGEALLDLCYQEDSRADVDFNVVMTDLDQYVEIQGAAEGKPFSKNSMETLMSMAAKGIKYLNGIQEAAIRTLSSR